MIRANMKILFIEQLRRSKTSYKPFERFMLTTFSILPTLYIRRLKAITPSHHQTNLINERYDEIPYKNNIDLVVIHFTTATAYRAYETADRFKSMNIPVILSGNHASSLPNEGLNHADSILMGRGEVNWLTLLKDIEKNKLKQIYPPEPYEQLSLPIPQTKVKLPGFQLMGAIEATRGCPYKCNFCPEANTPQGHVYYKRPVDDVISELKQIPQKIVMFYDTSLTVDPTYTKRLFKAMIPLKKHFFCNGNVDVLANDNELIRLSKKAGCIGWLIGFESISQETINTMHKPTNVVSIYKKAIENIHKSHMMVIGDFMFGFDTDSKDVFHNTVKGILDLHVDVADFTIATPFPGTPFYDRLKKENRLTTEDWSHYTMYSAVFKPQQMTIQDLKEGIILVYREFYSPKNTIKRVIRGLSLGFYPFCSLLARNSIVMFAQAKIHH